MSTENLPKMVFCVRADLNMRKGKICSQVGHAVEYFFTDKLDQNGQITFSNIEKEWLMTGGKKITCKITSENELNELYDKALEAKVRARVVVDHGYTEFHGVPTKTVLALGPDTPENLDKITGHLPLL